MDRLGPRLADSPSRVATLSMDGGFPHSHALSPTESTSINSGPDLCFQFEDTDGRDISLNSPSEQMAIVYTETNSPFPSSSSESDREHVYPSFNLIYEIKSNKINVLLWFTATQPTAIIQPYNAHVRNEFLQGCHFCLLGKSFLPPSSLSLPFSSFPSYLPILYLHENKLITLISKSDSVLESVIKLKVFMLINRPCVILLSLCVCTESAHTRFNSDSLLSSPFSCRAHPDLQLPLCACRLPASPTGLQMP